MQFALLCYNSEKALSELSATEEAEMMARVRAAEARFPQGARIGPSLRLMPTSSARFVRAGGEPVVTDGPFAETREQLLGFWIVECETLEEAVEAGRQLARERRHGGIEVRPLRAFNPG